MNVQSEAQRPKDSPQFPRSAIEYSEIALKADSGLRVELLKTARRRVTGLSQFVLATSVIGAVIFYLLIDDISKASKFPSAPVVMMSTLVVASLLLFASTRIQPLSEQFLLVC